MRSLIVTILTFFSVLFALGQTAEDSVKVYFNIGRWQFNPELDGNAESMKDFIDKVNMAAGAKQLDRIVIRSYASPEGSESFNKRLSQKRCSTIISLIEQGTGLPATMFQATSEGEAWDELRSAVEANPDVPARAKVLDIIDHTPKYVFNASGTIISGRKKQLMDLHGGRPWRWMLKHIFPKLRSAVAISFTIKPEVPEPVHPEVAEEVEVAPDTLTTEVDTVVATETIIEPDTVVVADTTATIATEIPPRHLFALKTNLLYYGILLPNLEFEWLITPNWSVAVEGNVAWWGHYRDNKSYRLSVIDAEARRWIKPRAPWHGLYVGLIAGGGWYDLQNGGNGKYGEGLMTGLSVGYMWPVTRSLSLEAAVGAGYVYTRYKEYEPFEGHHVYLRTKDLNYFGPIKAKFSLVWRFCDINKNKKIEPAI